MSREDRNRALLEPALSDLHKAVYSTNHRITKTDLYEAYKNHLTFNLNPSYNNLILSLLILLFVFLATPIVYDIFIYLLGIRCVIPNNYLVWEATRPISDCTYCKGINGPLILPNMTREEFKPYAYSSNPIILKNAISHWPAVDMLNYTFLKDLYSRVPDAAKSVQDECQFLHFKSNFASLEDVFKMSPDRAEFKNNERPWYVGWSNCHPEILAELRKLYEFPHFLPADAEIPNTDFIFLGYDQGAIMHLDYIPRLMWQAQLRGQKTWNLAPNPECDSVCKPFSFEAESGDAVLIDTRIWYHSTSIAKGDFSITIQSEYG